MKFLNKLRAIFRKEKLDAEMADEMRHHVELQTELNVKAGMKPDEARHAALRQFGNVASIQEQARETRAGAWLELTFKDAAFALRSMARSPGFSVLAVVILALGVGASLTVYAVVHALLWSPLKYRDSAQLVQIRSAHARSTITDLAPGTFGDLAGSSSFSTVAAHYYYYVNLTGIEMPVLLNSAEVTPRYFLLFGVAPQIGRLWDADDSNPGKAPVVVLSNEIWQSHFGGRNSIIGEQIILDDVPHTVIAVMPRSFKEPAETVRFWRPMRPGADNLAARDWRYWTVFGRLAPGSTVKSANLELDLLARRLATTYSHDYAGWSLDAINLREAVTRSHRAGLLLVLSGVGCLMAITLANLAGLTLVRAAARSGEFAVRHALGASKLQIGRLIIVEAGVVAVVGGSIGLLLALWGIAGLVHLLPEGWLPRADEISLSWPVAAVGVALSVLAGLVAGIIPAVAATSRQAADALKAAQRSIAGASSKRLRTTLVILEIAFTLMLLTGAGLLGRSLTGLMHRPSGLDDERVLMATVSMSAKRYDSPEKSWAYLNRAEQAVAALPAVESEGFSQTAPFRWGIPVTYQVAGRAPDDAELPAAFTDSVSVSYFRTVGISLVRGRLFTPDDDYRRPPIVIVSQAAARRYFGEDDPIGKMLVIGSGLRSEIVGVVSDVRRAGLAADIPLQVYRPLAQRTPAFATLMVRTALPPASLIASVREALAGVDPSTPVTEVVTLAQVVGRSIAQPRLHTLIFGLFASAALLLAAVGLYGLIAYAVAQRTREFAVRSALGANEGEVQRLVLREGLWLVGLGVGLGLLGSLAVSAMLRGLVFDIRVLDSTVFVAGPALLVAVGLVSCFIPARRAAKVDPMVALRAE